MAKNKDLSSNIIYSMYLLGIYITYIVFVTKMFNTEFNEEEKTKKGAECE